MKRVVIAALWAACLSASTAAAGDPAPDDKALATAAAAFDEGSEAYRQQSYATAADRFEAADEAVPSARALRMAIRARDQAGQPARAATLAGQAELRYPDDAKTVALAREILAKHGSGLHRLEVSCSEPCRLSLGDEALPGRARRRWVAYAAPGELTVAATFASGAPSDEQVLTARAGGSNSLSFVAALAGAPAPDPAPPAPRTAAPETSGDARPPAPIDSPDEEPSWIEHPGVFIALAVATAGVGAATIWSGVDTLKNPGTDAVREACRGQGTDCPEYQLGRDKQLRTNVLIGATAGTALLTAVFGIFVTEWGGPSNDEAEVAVGIGPGGAMVGWERRF